MIGKVPPSAEFLATEVSVSVAVLANMKSSRAHSSGSSIADGSRIVECGLVSTPAQKAIYGRGFTFTYNTPIASVQKVEAGLGIGRPTCDCELRKWSWGRDRVRTVPHFRMASVDRYGLGPDAAQADRGSRGRPCLFNGDGKRHREVGPCRE